MTALVSLIAGATGFLGYTIGSVRGAAREAKRKPKTPTCGCGHGYHAHSLEKPYPCNVAVERWTTTPKGSQMDHAPCACLHYVGPQPLNDVWPEGL